MSGIPPNKQRALTPKQRLERALRLEEPDLVPIWSRLKLLNPYNPQVLPGGFPKNREYYGVLMRFLRDYTDVIYHWAPDMGVWYSDPSCVEHKKRTVKESPDEIVVEYTVETPEGRLNCITKHVVRTGDSMSLKPFLSDPEDMERFLSIPYKSVKPDVSGFFKARERLGENGIMMVHVGHPFAHLFGLFGINRVYYWLKFDADTFHTLLETFTRRIIDYLRYLLKKGLGPLYHFVMHECAIPPWVSGQTFDEIIMPYDRRIYKVIHNHGCFVEVHCHGNAMNFLERFADMGVDMLDPCEPPPRGDVILKEAKKLVGDRMCLCGNIPSMERLTWKQTDELVRSAIREGAPGGGFMLTTTGGIWSPAQPDNNVSNFLRLIKTGRMYGRYRIRL